MNSIWRASCERPAFPTLEGDKRTDVLVIGGGMAGILITYFLKRAGVDVLLLEQDRILGGVTECTTAKITLQHGLLCDKLLRRFGEEKTRLFYSAQKRALAAYEHLCAEIPCDYEKKDAYVYSLNAPEKIEREIRALEAVGIHALHSMARELPMSVAGAVCVKDQAQFHPLKFAYAIARGLPIYEKSKVRELAPGRAVTERGTVFANKIVVATHFPILNKHGGYFIKMYQHRSYVTALAGAHIPDGMYIDEAEGGLSFRSYGNLLLLGGGGHRTGKQGAAWRAAEDFARTYYPDAHEVARFATQDCMTLDGIPYIGRYGGRTEGLYVATGFNKWGMSSSMVSAMLLSDLLCGKENEAAFVYSPSRSILHPQLIANAFSSFVGLITPTVPRCPHLGCALKYNPDEHSWDCPCHGSRFSESGEVLDNPATDDKKGLS